MLVAVMCDSRDTRCESDWEKCSCSRDLFSTVFPSESTLKMAKLKIATAMKRISKVLKFYVV